MTDLVRAHLALERCKVAIAQIQSAKSEIMVVAAYQDRMSESSSEALLQARRMYSDIEAEIKRIARSP
jgi:hypothetical protein